MIGACRIGVSIAALAAFAVVSVGVATTAPAQPSSGDGQRLLHDAATRERPPVVRGRGRRRLGRPRGTPPHRDVHPRRRRSGRGRRREQPGPSARETSAGSVAPATGRSSSDRTAPPPPRRRPTPAGTSSRRPGPGWRAGTTTAVVAADPSSGAPRARFFIDTATGTLLRRDALDAHGHLVREVSFEAFLPLGDIPSPVHPQATKTEEPVTLRSVPSGYQGPGALGSGYRLLGRYRQPDGTVQLYYGDGIFTLSLFEQKGTIDWGSLPAGTSV